MERCEEILAFRDHVRTFELSGDLERGVSLAESGHQLMETAFQLAFIERSEEAVTLVREAISYYQMALTTESTDISSDPLLSPVFQRLHYAAWWIDGREPPDLLRKAARAYCHGLSDTSDLKAVELYCAAAWLWLEAGDPGAAEPWIDLVDANERGGNLGPACSLLRPISRALAHDASASQASQDLAREIESLSSWGQPTAGTLWDALQLADVHRRLVAPVSSFPELLLRIR
jgi:hypothetical protein